MARTRLLHPDFFTDPKVVGCSPLARLLFQGLWCLADREGRLEGDLMALKLRILPADNCDIGQLLHELMQAGLVRAYAGDDRALLYLPGFTKRQKPHAREAASVFPPPTQEAETKGAAEFPGLSSNAKQVETRMYASPRVSVSVSKSVSVSETVSKLAGDKRPPTKKAPDPRWQPTVAALEQAFKETTGHTYRFAGAKDGDALKALLASETPEEILRRWRVGLSETGYRHTDDIAQLRSKWNGLATGPPKGSAARAPVEPSSQWKPEDSQGPNRGEEVHW